MYWVVPFEPRTQEQRYFEAADRLGYGDGTRQMIFDYPWLMGSPWLFEGDD